MATLEGMMVAPFHPTHFLKVTFFFFCFNSKPLWGIVQNLRTNKSCKLCLKWLIVYSPESVLWLNHFFQLSWIGAYPPPMSGGVPPPWPPMMDNSKSWDYYSRREDKRDKERDRPRERTHEREREREHSPSAISYTRWARATHVLAEVKIIHVCMHGFSFHGCCNIHIIWNVPNMGFFCYLRSDEERYRYREYQERAYGDRHRDRSSREKEERHRERRHRDKEEGRHKSSRRYIGDTNHSLCGERLLQTLQGGGNWSRSYSRGNEERGDSFGKVVHRLDSCGYSSFEEQLTEVVRKSANLSNTFVLGI